MGLYDLGGGGGGLYGGAPPVAQPSQTKTPSKGLFGLGFGPDLNLGLGSLASMPLQAVGGLAHLAAAAVTPWRAPSQHILSSAGEGMLGGLGNTLADIPGAQYIANPIVHGVGALTGAEPLQQYKAQPIWQRVQRGEGILPALVQDIGNVALGAGAVAKMAGVGTALAGGEAAVAEGLAGEGNLASRLSQIQHGAELAAHPYQTAYRSAVSPFARAGALARETALGIDPLTAARTTLEEEVPLAPPKPPTTATAPVAERPQVSQPRLPMNIGKATPEFGPEPLAAERLAEAGQPVLPGMENVSAPGIAEDALGNRRRTAAPGRATLDELPPEGNAPVGPRMQAAEARRTTPIPASIQNLVNAAPEFVQNFLAKTEGRLQKFELKGITRELTLLGDVATRQALASPEIQSMYAAARQHLMFDETGAPRTLPNGKTVDALVADNMFGEAVRQRATGREYVLNVLRDNNALPAEAELVKRGIIGKDTIPAPWIVANPALDEAITAGAQTTKSLASRQMAQLTGGRLGTEGLENVGKEAPIMTAGEAKALKGAQKELERLAKKETQNAKTRARLESMQEGIADKESLMLKAEDAARASGRLAAEFTDKSPELFRSPRWGAVLNDFVSGILHPGDGATLSPSLGRKLEIGQDTGWAVGVKEIAVPGFEHTEGRVPLSEWNRVIDPQTGLTAGAQIVAKVAHDYQNSLASTDLAIGLWADPAGNVSIDITQTALNGRPMARQAAMQRGFLRGQDEIFNIDTGNTVPTAARAGDVDLRTKAEKSPLSKTAAEKNQALDNRLEKNGSRAMKNSEAAEAKQARVDVAQARVDKAKLDLQKNFTLLGAEETAVLGGQKAAMKAMAKVFDAQDNPGIVNTPAQFKPIWHAYTSLVDEAAKTGDVRLAQELAAMADGLPDLIDKARAQGFDPQYIPKMSPQQVRRVMYQSMQLVRPGTKLGEEGTAAARYTSRYANPQLMDRSIAGLASGMVDAVHESHVNAVTEYVEDAFARPIPKDGVVPTGWRAWSATKSYLATGEKTAEGVQVGGNGTLMIPEHLDNTLRSFGQDFRHPVFDTVRKATDPWRTLMLPLRPAWYAHTIIGHAIMTVAGGARLGDWADAWRAFREGQVGRQLTSHFTPDTVGATRGSVANEFLAGGETARTAMPATLREGLSIQHPLQSVQNLSGRMSRAAMMVDELGRVATYFSGKRAGMTDIEALGKVHRVLVDYGDLSPFEQSFVRTVVPFYAFQKGVLKVASRYAIDHPAIMGITFALGDLNKQLQKDKYGGELPDAYAATVKMGPLGNVNLAPFSSFGDSGKLLTAEGIGASVNPFVKFGASQLFGSSGPGTQYRLTATGGKQEVMRPAQLFEPFTNAPQVQALAQTAAAGGAPGFQSPAGRFTGLGGYSNAQLAQAAATQMRGEGALHGTAPSATEKQVQAAGLPLTKAQASAAATKATKSSSLYRKPTRTKKPHVAKAIHHALRKVKRRTPRHR